MDTFPTGSSSRCWQWSLQRTHTKRHFPLQQALSLSWPGVEDDGGKQLERHPAAAGDQFTISLVHADFLYENWKRPQQQKMNALLCLSAIKLVSPFLDCGQDNSLPRQGQHRQDQLRGVLRGRFFWMYQSQNLCRWLETRIFTRRWLWRCELAPSCQRIDAKWNKALRKNGNSRTNCLVNLK